MTYIISNYRDDEIPLCVDLDGTLMRTDALWETMMLLLRRNPLYLFRLPFWFLKGRACLKKEIASRTYLNPANLPYHEPFLNYLKSERNRGRRLILATASDVLIAENIADYLGVFDGVIASNGTTNMRGSSKCQTLVDRYGSRMFDYAGNSSVDLDVWSEARHGIVVNADDKLLYRAREITEVTRVFNEPRSLLRLITRALRPHQWFKNIIIFVPLLTSHTLNDLSLVKRSLVAFVAFSLCASSVYILNDLLDLESDRQHHSKRNRPFASGNLALPVGMVLAPLLLGSSAGVGFMLGLRFMAVLGIYFAMTLAYSFRIKQMVLLDVFFLAGLYTMRLVAGHTAAHIGWSFWLLAFSMFVFLSLALVKRFTELNQLRLQNKKDSKGRGYTTDDAPLVAILGICSGFLATMVMALYVNSAAAVRTIDGGTLYEHPIWLLMICPLLLYWISYVWMRAYRDQMHDDPIVFALKDKMSYLVGFLSLLVIWLATLRFK